MKKKVFDLKGYLKLQKKVATECPTNRHAARVRFSCSDEELTISLLMKQFVDGGGIFPFAMENRNKFLHEVELPDTAG